MQEVRSESSAAELGDRQLFTRGKQQESCSADPCDSVTDDTSENGTLIRSPCEVACGERDRQRAAAIALDSGRD